MALQVAGTLFAAVLFSGENLMFKHTDPQDYSKESHRHNLQMEKYARDHKAWSRQNILNEEKIKYFKMKKHNANVNFNVTNKNFKIRTKIQEVLPAE